MRNFYRPVDFRSRHEMTQFLSSHFRYPTMNSWNGCTSYACNVTYAEAIQKMASALKMTLYGTLGDGQMVPLTDEELVAFVEAQNCSPMRKHITV